MSITVRYRAVDGARTTRKFKTLEGARNYAQRMIGEHPDLGSTYAVSFDGIGIVYVEGCTLNDLFPSREADAEAAQEAAMQDAMRAEYEAEKRGGAL